MADGGISIYYALATAAVSAGATAYSANQQAKSAQNAADFNAEQARNAAKVKSEDDRENSLRRQEQHRKYIEGVRAKMLEDSHSIEGADADFLDEAEGNLQTRILDQAAANNRQQAGIENQAFRYEYQGDQAAQAGKLNTATAVVSGFNSVYSTGQRGGLWGQPDRIPAAKQPSAI